MKPPNGKHLLACLLLAFGSSCHAQNVYQPLADLWGLEPIATLELKNDDIELRYWSTGFGSKAYILSRRNGGWKAFHIGENRETVMASLHGYRAAQVQLMCDPDTLLDQLKAFGVEHLEPARPAPNCVTSNGEICSYVSLDGWSSFIEFKTSTRFVSQHYQNPGLPHFAKPGDDPMEYPTFRAGQMYGLLDHGLGGRATSSIKPHSRSFSLPAIVLSRPTYAGGVQAVLIYDYDNNEQGGKVHYDSRYFQEYPQGFETTLYDADNNEVQLSWTGQRRQRFGNGPETFWLAPDGDQWQAYQDYESAADTLSHELAVVQKGRFRDLTYVDLSGGFERELAGSSVLRECRSIKPLTAKTPPTLATEVQVDPQNIDSLGWRVLPPALEGLKIVKVRNLYDEFWIGIADDISYHANQQLTVTHEYLPPPPGSDKPVILTRPVD